MSEMRILSDHDQLVAMRESLTNPGTRAEAEATMALDALIWLTEPGKRNTLHIGDAWYGFLTGRVGMTDAEASVTAERVAE